MIKHSKQSGSAHVIIIVILIIALLGTLGFVFWNSVTKNVTKKETPTADTKETSKTTSPDPYSSWLACNDIADGLKFRYPATWSKVDGPSSACDSATPEIGNEFQVISPKRAGSSYVYRVQFFGDISGDKSTIDTNKGQTILDVLPLEVPNAKKPLSLVAFADNTQNQNAVFMFTVTDQKYTVGESVDYVPKVTNQKNGKAYELIASMATSPNQQYVGSYSLADYKAQPDYTDVIKLYQSLSY